MGPPAGAGLGRGWLEAIGAGWGAFFRVRLCVSASPRVCESARPRGGRCACGRDACARPCVPGWPSVWHPGVGVWVWVCVVGWADIRFQMSKHLCVCAHLSLGVVPLLAHLHARVYLCHLCPSPVCLRVLVCTRISMRVSACRAGDLWGCILEETHPTTRPIAQPPEAGSVEVAGDGRVPTQAATGAACVGPGLGWGRSERFSRWPEEPSRAALPLPCPTPGSEFLGSDLDSYCVFMPCSFPPTRKEEGGTKLPMRGVDCCYLSQAPPPSPLPSQRPLALCPRRASVSLRGPWRGKAPWSPCWCFMASTLLRNSPGERPPSQRGVEKQHGEVMACGAPA